MKLIKFFLIIFIYLIISVKVYSNEEVINKVKEGGKIIFIRHAYAPGNGDPSNFDINDCSTQRNLSEEGRKQAVLIGLLFRKYDIPIDEVISSEWCRCKETASLLDIGKWRVFSGLNSFFQDYADKGETLNNLNRKLTQLEDGVTLMISHQVVIRAITGSTTRSGELVVFNSKTKAFKNILLN